MFIVGRWVIQLRMAKIFGTALVLGVIGQAGLIAQADSPGHIRILVLQGAGAINYSKGDQTVIPVIAVLDENDRPVEGASVTFELPTTGPGASFEGGRFDLSVTTNAQGQAAAVGLRINGQAGRFTIRVSAIWNRKTAQVALAQVNSVHDISTASDALSVKVQRSSRN